MGAWGPGVFSDDTAADIRSDYRELLEDRVPDDVAARRIIESYAGLDADEEHLLWLALAAAQSSFGRLDDVIKERALAVIDQGRGLAPWAEAGPSELKRRQAALAKLRDTLVGPQPPRRPIRRPWRHETDLLAGDLLALPVAADRLLLVRVLRVDDHRVGKAPILEWLDWSGSKVPSDRKLRKLRTTVRSHPGGSVAATFRVGQYKKRDPGWSQVGFVRAGRLVRPSDQGARAHTYADWLRLVEILRREGALDTAG